LRSGKTTNQQKLLETDRHSESGKAVVATPRETFFFSFSMFYSQLILAKKGTLGKIWLAAHFAKKINKVHVHSTDIDASVGK
jgi:hypothetical protein